MKADDIVKSKALAILSFLGFVDNQNDDASIFHPLLGVTLDMRDLELRDVAVYIYYLGHTAGGEKTRDDIRRALGL